MGRQGGKSSRSPSSIMGEGGVSSSLVLLMLSLLPLTTVAWNGGGSTTTAAYPWSSLRRIILPTDQQQQLVVWPTLRRPQVCRKKWPALFMEQPSFSSSSSSSIDWSMDGCPSEIIHGETLLRVHFGLPKNYNAETEMQNLSLYLQSFPFARVLPVQPIMYGGTPQNHHHPNDNEDGGGNTTVELSFLRKKTAEKGMFEGGIDFCVAPFSSGRIELTAKRNARGQTVSKLWSERLVISALVKCLTGTADAIPTARSVGDSLSVLSLVHKWM